MGMWACGHVVGIGKKEKGGCRGSSEHGRRSHATNYSTRGGCKRHEYVFAARHRARSSRLVHLLGIGLVRHEGFHREEKIGIESFPTEWMRVKGTN